MVHRRIGLVAMVVCTLLGGGSMMRAAEKAAADESYSFLDGVNKKGIGHFSGQVQMLLMRRDYERGEPDGDDNSGTIALTLNYTSPDFHGLSAGVQAITSQRMFDAGSNDDAMGADWILANSDFSLFNEAYLKLNLKEAGLAGTTFTLGRQILNLDFAPNYAIRQKAQSYEAVVLKIDEVKDLSLTIGHIERLSSWVGRDSDTRAPNADFEDVRYLEGVRYSTSGTQFASVTYTGVPKLSVTLYDFFSQDLYNTLGAKAGYKVDLSADLQATLKGHAITQRDNGRMDDDGVGEINADLYDLSVEFKMGKLALEPGFTHLRGTDQENDLHVPFRTSLTIDSEMLWGTRQFQAGGDAYYLKATYAMGKAKFYALYVYQNHERGRMRTGALRNAATDQEVDFVVSYAFTNNFYGAVKVAFAEQDNRDGVRNSDLEDLRLFVGYKF